MKERGQISTEYLILVGVILIILIPALVLWGVYTVNSRQTTNRAQAQEAALTIVKRAESIYYLGEGSQNVAQVRVPQGVRAIEVYTDPDDGGGEFVFTLIGPQGQEYEIVSRSRVPIRYGVDSSGRDILFSVEEGIRDFKMVSMGGHVCITTVSGICPSTPMPGPEPPGPGPSPTPRPIPPDSRACEEVCLDEGAYGSCQPYGSVASLPEQTCTLLPECARTGLTGGGYKEWFQAPENPCGESVCWCYRRTCCTSSQTCESGTSECRDVIRPPTPGVVGIAICSNSPKAEAIQTRYCEEESDEICPLDFSQDFSQVDKNFCCQEDPNCQTSLQCT